VARACDAGQVSRKDCAGVILYTAEKATQVPTLQCLTAVPSVTRFLSPCQALKPALCLWSHCSPFSSGGSASDPDFRWERLHQWSKHTPKLTQTTHFLTSLRTVDYPTGRILRDAKLYEIGAGTSEIRRMLIGREIFQEGK
jgi:alkylation response protein AidB-like acyl-CoA dehydrogenase